MKRLVLFAALLATPAHADAFIYGPDCGQCHTPIPSNIYHHIDQLMFGGNVPAGDDIYRTWGATNKVPETPLPGAIWLLAAPLLWIAYKFGRPQ